MRRKIGNSIRNQDFDFHETRPSHSHQNYRYRHRLNRRRLPRFIITTITHRPVVGNNEMKERLLQVLS